MATYKAILKVGGNEYKMTKCIYTLIQPTEEKTNRPTSAVIGGTIECWVKTTDDLTFFEWMCDPSAKKDGTIEFYKMHENAVLKKLEFKEAYCVQYDENFEFTGGEGPTMQHFKLASKVIKVGESEHSNEWKI